MEVAEGFVRGCLMWAINRTIAPKQVVSIGPDLYWFTLPFDHQTYNQATHPTIKP